MLRNVMFQLALAASVSAVAIHTNAETPKRHPVLMISIDGLRPDYVTEADKHGLKIPVLRSFLQKGAYADSVQNVSPTVTYPNHTTLVTGVSPNEHGIYNNTVFDPMGKEQSAWNWYGAQVKVPTLWQAAKASGLTTGSVLWPVTVHSRGIDYNVPEYWRTKTEYDHYLLEAVSTPSGFLEEAEKDAGPFYSGEGNLVLDEKITRTAISMIQAHHPDLVTIHIVALDHLEHAHGPFSPEANETLEQIDAKVGRIISAELRVHPDADIVITSDHGFLPVTHKMNLNAALVKAGLLTVSAGPKPHVTAWKAFAWSADGSAMVVLNDNSDKATEQQVAQLLSDLAKDPANGINQVLSRSEAAAIGVPEQAAFIVDWKSGYHMGSGLSTPLVEDTAPGGAHGYLATHPELHSSFFIVGPDIAKSKKLGTIDMRQIAPTLARELGIVLPSAKMQPLTLK
ncbi:alkaline phosphatase family protein [Edaphobacter albus]|uniref:alkaline phosphatase family protein n=1 Tax=Edaphobacter sp. 4G125 TaxID=2763071 RepID=UPI001646C4DE|nr:ectonucleotide pyrophosphatase/phosphodiesterase [Edaphobacter sp. 4G125]QNI37685.1 alkaline phosphatase family protein [Edaphobacter sp. 4G125]